MQFYLQKRPYLIMILKNNFAYALIVLLCCVPTLSQSAEEFVRLHPALLEDHNVEEYAISEDGETVVYIADQDTDDVFELYSVPTDGGVVTKLNSLLVTGSDVKQFKISPDSQNVIYTVEALDPTDMDLFSVPIGGGSPILLNDLDILLSHVTDEFEISSDSSRVVFRVTNFGVVTGMYSVLVDGTSLLELTPRSIPGPASNAVRVLEFSITPDASTVVYRANQDSTSEDEIYSVPISGGASTKLSGALLSGLDVQRGFSISPDNLRVVYRAERFINNEFYLYSAPVDGSSNAVVLNGTLPISGSGDVEDDFMISPDSTQVVYRADQNQNNVIELFSVPIAGGTPVRLNPNLVLGGNVVAKLDTNRSNYFEITPDSARVIYMADQEIDTVFELYSVPIGGGSVTKLNLPFIDPTSVFGTKDIDDFRVSHNGNFVVYRGNAGNNADEALYKVSTSGGRATLASALERGRDIDAFDDYLITPNDEHVIYILDRDQFGVKELFSTEFESRFTAQLNPEPTSSRFDVKEIQVSANNKIVYKAQTNSLPGSDELFSVAIPETPPQELCVPIRATNGRLALICL